MDRTEMRKCGKRYASAEAARVSKRGRTNPSLVPERCPCGGWHLRKPEKPRAAVKTARRDTGPSMQTRAMVFARDRALCAGCGKNVQGIPHSVQHRVARGMGGTRRPEANAFWNLLLLCGDATTPGGCHASCERRDPEMHVRGLWLESWERPDLIPVRYATAVGLRHFWLTSDGTLTSEPPSEAAA